MEGKSKEERITGRSRLSELIHTAYDTKHQLVDEIERLQGHNNTEFKDFMKYHGDYDVILNVAVDLENRLCSKAAEEE